MSELTVQKHAAYVEVPWELPIDSGAATEEQARAAGWVPTPRPRVSRWARLRWRWWDLRERVGRRVGSWIAGVDLSERDE